MAEALVVVPPWLRVSRTMSGRWRKLWGCWRLPRTRRFAPDSNTRVGGGNYNHDPVGELSPTERFSIVALRLAQQKPARGPFGKP